MTDKNKFIIFNPQKAIQEYLHDILEGSEKNDTMFSQHTVAEIKGLEGDDIIFGAAHKMDGGEGRNWLLPVFSETKKTLLAGASQDTYVVPTLLPNYEGQLNYQIDIQDKSQDNRLILVEDTAFKRVVDVSVFGKDTQTLEVYSVSENNRHRIVVADRTHISEIHILSIDSKTGLSHKKSYTRAGQKYIESDKKLSLSQLAQDQIWTQYFAHYFSIQKKQLISFGQAFTSSIDVKSFLGKQIIKSVFGAASFRLQTQPYKQLYNGMYKSFILDVCDVYNRYNIPEKKLYFIGALEENVHFHLLPVMRLLIGLYINSFMDYAQDIKGKEIILNIMESPIWKKYQSLSCAKAARNKIEIEIYANWVETFNSLGQHFSSSAYETKIKGIFNNFPSDYIANMSLKGESFEKWRLAVLKNKKYLMEDDQSRKLKADFKTRLLTILDYGEGKKFSSFAKATEVLEHFITSLPKIKSYVVMNGKTPQERAHFHQVFIEKFFEGAILSPQMLHHSLNLYNNYKNFMSIEVSDNLVINKLMIKSLCNLLNKQSSHDFTLYQ